MGASGCLVRLAALSLLPIPVSFTPLRVLCLVQGAAKEARPKKGQVAPTMQVCVQALLAAFAPCQRSCLVRGHVAEFWGLAGMQECPAFAPCGLSKRYGVNAS